MMEFNDPSKEPSILNRDVEVPFYVIIIVAFFLGLLLGVMI